MKIIIRLYKKGKVIKWYITSDRTKFRKMYSKLASAVAEKYFVRVEYGYDKDASGKRIMFYNEYFGSNLREAKQALSAFIEK